MWMSIPKSKEVRETRCFSQRHLWPQVNQEAGGVASCGQGSPTLPNPNPVSSLRLWASLRGCWVLMLMTVRHQEEGVLVCFIVVLQETGQFKLKNRPPMTIHFVRMMTLCESVHLPTIGMHTLHGGSSNPTQHFLAISAGWGSSKSEGLSS